VVKDFKEFILRGNVVDLAVGVVIGLAFGAVVTSFTADLLTPLVSIPGRFRSRASPSRCITASSTTGGS